MVDEDLDVGGGEGMSPKSLDLLFSQSYPLVYRAGGFGTLLATSTARILGHLHIYANSRMKGEF